MGNVSPPARWWRLTPGTPDFGWPARSAPRGSGAVIVPSTPSPGFAAACVAVSLLRRPDRPALAVIDRAEAEATAVILDAAAALGIRVPVEAWDPEGDRLDADAHRDRLRQLVLGGFSAGDKFCTLATDPAPAFGDDRGRRADRGLDLIRTIDRRSGDSARSHPASCARS